ncbi:MAG: dUTP diphosphatase [Gammaproteobacteria bacterium]|nr:dUTP diphosphatase [Gammaproteobacteria bacterium]
MKDKLLVMLELQDAMNSRVNSNWRQANNEWYRAIWTECAEMLDHYGWKWWKHQQPDLDQVRLELVDILHFAMSDYLLQDGDNDEVAARILDEMACPGKIDDMRQAIESMAQSTIADQSMHFSGFANIMRLIEMDFDQLYRMYVGKNVLNFFRQDHGYRDGSYIKVWQDREDNEHLAELLASLDSDSAQFKDQLYQGLLARYPVTPSPNSTGSDL